ncbi:hypothetical protein LJR118_003086 [Acidovorax sp. LjRoot118]|uniref:hypothetical protein n=1 Tax=unclassified Acidovorax TaxID=2684926 RepID=UPI0012F836BE|nr:MULTISPECIES: hypothetical protein [unclassified Acidovorax]
MTNKEFPASMTPLQSVSLLRSFLGKELVSFTRYSLFSKEEAAAEIEKPVSLVFEGTEGPVGLNFEGAGTLGVGEDDSLNSAIVWLDRDKDGQPDFSPMDESVSVFFPIEASDPVFSRTQWSEFIGDRLIGMSIIKENPINPRLYNRPCEIALCLNWQKNGKFAAILGGHGDDYWECKLMLWNAVQPKLNSRFYEVPLL